MVIMGFNQVPLEELGDDSMAEEDWTVGAGGDVSASPQMARSSGASPKGRSISERRAAPADPSREASRPESSSNGLLAKTDSFFKKNIEANIQPILLWRSFPDGKRALALVLGAPCPLVLLLPCQSWVPQLAVGLHLPILPLLRPSPLLGNLLAQPA